VSGNTNERDADRLRKLEQENEALRERIAHEEQKRGLAEQRERAWSYPRKIGAGVTLGGLLALGGSLAYWASLPDSLGSGIFLVAFVPMIGIAGAVAGGIVGCLTAYWKAKTRYRGR
jgi:hypothetical protein